MNRKLGTTFLVSAVLLLALLPLHACASAISESVRIGLTQFGSGVKQITISSLFGPIILESADARTSYNSAISLETSASGLVCKIDNTVLNAGSTVTLSPEDPAAFLVVNCPSRSDRQYRGSIELSLKSGSIKLVNILSVDDYLKGVLPAELGSGAPEEALKAQAIVARTYTLTNADKHSALGYGLCDSTCCQTYSGVHVESKKCTKAIIDTADQVIYYGDKLAEVFYSTDCGGVTQSYEEAYKRPAFPYLGAVADPCELDHYSWEKSLKLPDLGAKLMKAGVKEADGIQSIRVSGQGPSGRAQSLEILGKLGATTISSSKFRAALGYDVVKSTLFTLESAEDGSVLIKGKGWGHGIGLCQTGAIQLAESPHDYTCDMILAHYFPGTHISQLDAPNSTETLISAVPNTTAVDNAPAIKSTKSIILQAASSTQPPLNDEQTKKLFQVRVKAPDSL